MARLYFPLLATLIWPTTATAGAALKPYLAMQMEDYPPEALAAGVEGDVKVTLVGGDDGQVVSCRATSSGPAMALKDATCAQLTKRVRLTAKPGGASLTIMAEWRISKTQAISFGGAIPISPRYWIWADDYPPSEFGGATRTVEGRYDIGVDGRATHCAVTVSSSSPALDAKACEVIEKRATFLPAVTPAGAPRPTIGTFKITFR